MHIGRGHTAGDVVAFVPDADVVFSGDLVEYRSACYCGDAHFTDWPETLDRLAEFQAKALVPGRGAALTDAAKVTEGIEMTTDFLTTLYGSVQKSVAMGRSLKDDLRRRARGDGPEILLVRDLRALHAVQRLARLRRGARHRLAGDLDRRTRPRNVGRAARLSAHGAEAMTVAGRPNARRCFTSPTAARPIRMRARWRAIRWSWSAPARSG